MLWKMTQNPFLTNFAKGDFSNGSMPGRTSFRSGGSGMITTPIVSKTRHSPWTKPQTSRHSPSPALSSTQPLRDTA